MDKFEKASRLKLRFAISRGVISSEDLWDLPLTQLNTLAKKLNKMVKAEGEEDFISTKSTVRVELQLAFDIAKHVIDVKLDENAKKKVAQEKKARKQTILRLISEKKDEALSAKSIAELEAELEEM